MGFRNISAWSIRNPVPSLVLFTFLTLAGIISFMRMDVQNDPDIDFPVVLMDSSHRNILSIGKIPLFVSPPRIGKYKNTVNVATKCARPLVTQVK
jgi:hypothetical protein